MNALIQYLTYAFVAVFLISGINYSALGKHHPHGFASGGDKGEYCSVDVSNDSNKYIATLLRTAYETALRNLNADSYNKCINAGEAQDQCTLQKNQKDDAVTNGFREGGVYDALFPVDGTAKVIDFSTNTPTENYHTTLCYDGNDPHTPCSSLPFPPRNLCSIYQKSMKSIDSVKISGVAQFGRFVVITLSPTDLTNDGTAISTTFHVSLGKNVDDTVTPYLLDALKKTIVSQSGDGFSLKFNHISCSGRCQMNVSN